MITNNIVSITVLKNDYIIIIIVLFLSPNLFLCSNTFHQHMTLCLLFDTIVSTVPRILNLQNKS